MTINLKYWHLPIIGIGAVFGIILWIRIYYWLLLGWISFLWNIDPTSINADMPATMLAVMTTAVALAIGIPVAIVRINWKFGK